MPKKAKPSRKLHNLPRAHRDPTPLEEFMEFIEPEEVLEALREFQLNWCDHPKDDVEKFTSNPSEAICMGCGLIWKWGTKPPKGDLK